MLILTTLLILGAAALDLCLRRQPVQSISALYLVLSLFALLAYGLDKLAAIRARQRIPERSLLLLGLLGGWPGAWLAQSLFRHKTAKASFRWRFWCCAGLNIAALLAVLHYTSSIPLLTSVP